MIKLRIDELNVARLLFFWSLQQFFSRVSMGTYILYLSLIFSNHPFTGVSLFDNFPTEKRLDSDLVEKSGSFHWLHVV